MPVSAPWSARAVSGSPGAATASRTAHAVAQRSGQRPAIRSDLPARRRERRRLDADRAPPIRENDAYRARHGQGYTVFEHNSHAIGQELTVFVPGGRGRQRRSGQGLPPAAAQRFLPDAPAHRYVVRRMGARVRSRRPAVAYPDLPRRGIGSAACPSVLEGGVARHSAFAAASPKASSWSCDRDAVPRARRLAVESRRAGSGAAGQSGRGWIGPLRRPAGRRHTRTGPARRRWSSCWARPKLSRMSARFWQRCESADQVEKALAAHAHLWDSTLGRAAGADTGSVGRFAVKPMAPISIAELPILGPLCTISIQWRFWIPGSAAGFDGVRLCGPANCPAAHSDCGGAPVSGRRCPALVASGNRRGRPDALLGRLAVAAVRGGALRQSHGRYAAFSTKRCRFSKGRRSPTVRTSACSPRRCPLPQRLFGSIARGRWTTPGNCGPHESAVDRQRRLERRHEPGRRRKGAARVSGSAGSSATVLESFAQLMDNRERGT